MFEVFLILSTVLFGSSIILLIKQSTFSLILHLLLGWLTGSMITGIFVTILTHFIQLTTLFVVEIIIAQVIFSAAAVLLLYVLHKSDFKYRLKINLEAHPWLLLSLVIAGIASIYFSGNFYKYFPHFIPKQARYDVETEHSIIASIIGGCNVKHPKFFSLEDPFLYKSNFKKSPITYSFSACLLKISGSYKDVSILICFFNSLATAYAMFTLSSQFTKFQLVCVLLLLFNGSWGFIKYFRVRDVHADLVHNWGREYNTPFYQIFFKFLISSKDASFSLPIALFAVTLTCSPKRTKGFSGVFAIAGLLAALCPSFMSSIAVFIFAACNYNSFLEVIPFALSLFIKYRNGALKYMPVWKEYQMNGVFFSQIWCWFEAFGPIAFSISLFPFIVREPYLIQRCITVLCSLAFCSFFRNGGYYEDGALAVASTVFPIYIIATVHMFNKCISEIYGNTRGYILGLGAACVALMVGSGLVSCTRSTSQLMVGIPEKAMIVEKWIRSHSSYNSLFYAPNIEMIPITFLTGRRIITGLPGDLWRRGEKYSEIVSKVNTAYGWPAIKQLMTEYGATYLLSGGIVGKIDLNLFTAVESSHEWCLLKIKE